MARHKLKKFEQNRLRDNVIESDKAFYKEAKGNWNKVYFKNNHPIVLELACGRGEYTIGLAETFPEKNFIGVDIKGDRLWKGSGIALEKDLKNAAFLRCHILYLEEFFAPSEVSEIWITFPDPQPRKSRSRHRLTHSRFLKMYRNILNEKGWVKLKTDSDLLYEFTQAMLLEEKGIKNTIKTDDLYESSLLDEHYGIQTQFEQKWLAQGLSIKYIKFQFDI